MQVITPRFFLVGLTMLVAAGLALALTPREKTSDSGPKINLETMIPKQFGVWKVDETLVPLRVSPDVQDRLDKLYSQTLTRTYVNGQGERVMLSIAYGDDQTGTLRVHRPDVCYTAQGFHVSGIQQDKITLDNFSWPVVRVFAEQERRREPITYWMTVGDTIATSGNEQRLNQLRYGLLGEIPDGILFRVSSIDNDRKHAHALQDVFVKDLLKNLPDSDRRRLIGKS